MQYIAGETDRFAQFSAMIHDERMDLEPGPLWERLLLEEPGTLVLTLALGALALLLIAQRQRSRRMVWVALVPSLLAAGVFVTARLVTTEREHLTQRVAEVLTLTAPLDVPKLRETLAPDTALYGPTGELWAPPAALQLLLPALERIYPIARQEQRGLSIQFISDTEALTLLDLRSSLRDPQYLETIATRWLIAWRREGSGPWKISRVQWLKLQDQTPSRGLLPGT